MIEKKVLPDAARLTQINPMTKGTYSEDDAVRPSSQLSASEKKLFSRMAEV
jgi:hypothetical protein